MKDENGNDKVKQQFPSKVQVPLKASLSWQVAKTGPLRILKRKRVPPKRYGKDVLKVDNGEKEKHVEKREHQKHFKLCLTNFLH